VVAALLGVIALIVLPAAMNASTTQMDEAARRVRADLSYAQSQAIVLRKPQCIVCDATQGFYYLAPAAAPAAPMTDPISDKPYMVFFSRACGDPLLRATSRVQEYPDVDLVSASFDESGTLTFSALGLPLGPGGAALISGTIEIAVGSRRSRIAVDPTTGTASIQDSSSG
jgi:hypothetical protein